jgi:hypothetical protein
VYVRARVHAVRRACTCTTRRLPFDFLSLTKVATAEIATQTPRLASVDLGLSF